jgi:hypothetical protein
MTGAPMRLIRALPTRPALGAGMGNEAVELELKVTSANIDGIADSVEAVFDLPSADPLCVPRQLLR